jgi:S1-C subfamily serine protease
VDESTSLQQVSDGLAAAVERAGASTVLVSARRRIPASGVVWADGLIVTADHVIENEDDITIGLPDGREVQAQLVGRDPSSDLALLRVEGGGLTPAELAPAGATKVGHFVLAVGRPTRGGVQASGGVVSAAGGPWRRRHRHGAQVDSLLRSDTTFYPGFSGGPLVDAQGRVVGINSSAFGRGRGLTIEAEAVTKVVEVLRAHGRVRRAYLGIASQGVRLPEALAVQLEDQQTGLLVLNVEPGTPAAAAGLLVGDILVGIEGAAVRDADDLQEALGPERVGASVRLQLLRGGQSHEVTATLDERA